MNALQALNHHWGYDRFLPLQQAAIDASITGRDSLVVLPTGGGKSLCYQLPALLHDGLTIVVSPLISLMKDQVDALGTLDIPAASLNSSLSHQQQHQVINDCKSGAIKLLYVAPERLTNVNTITELVQCNVASIAIDEAHCISSWGHDFRPEYRQLKMLRQTFPNLAMHAYTATATPQVRQDIIEQLGLKDPVILVGDFHRKNLNYFIKRRQSGLNQVADVIERHRDNCGIIYAISRSKVESISETLNQLGYRTLPYHAGLTEKERTHNQEALINDEIQVIVATVAFGMGIDKSNVRYVIHAEMPKSLENYQQESGRAGRDGLEAECWLFYAGRDAMAWRKMAENSTEEKYDQTLRSIDQVERFCMAHTCRHAQLVKHFGQSMSGSCDACDVCLGQVSLVEDPKTLAQKILSCVIRCEQKFGADHIAKVLKGSRESKITRVNHDKLSTWGLLKEYPKPQIVDWIDQLVQQRFLKRVGDHSIVKLTLTGKQALKGQSVPKLTQANVDDNVRKNFTPTTILDSWEGVDRGLFDELRQWRSEVATNKTLAAFIIFSDATLRDLARRRPTTNEILREVHGIGEKKARDYGASVMAVIKEYCESKSIQTDVPAEKNVRLARPDRIDQVNKNARAAFPLFEKGTCIEDICQQLQRAESTVYQYLSDYIHVNKITDPTPWVDPKHITLVETVASYAGTERLKPIRDALHNRIDYKSIRIIVACYVNKQRETSDQALADNSFGKPDAK